MSINLSYGDQRRLEIARALVLRAEAAAARRADRRDEPAGVEGAHRVHAPAARRDAASRILLIEHDMQVVMGVSEHITVLDHGTEDRRGHAAGGAAEPAGDRGLPRQAGGARPTLRPARSSRRSPTDGACSRSRTSTRTTATSRRSRASRSRSRRARCVTLIGSNGAGKSTTLRSISGLTPPRQGSIRFEDREITEMPPQEIVAHGRRATRPRAGTCSRA